MQPLRPFLRLVDQFAELRFYPIRQRRRLGASITRAAGLLAMRLARDRYGPTGVERWSLVIKHDDGRRSIGGDFRNVPTIREIATQAQFASGRKGESGFAIRCPDDTSPTAFRISVGVVKALRSQ